MRHAAVLGERPGEMLLEPGPGAVPSLERPLFVADWDQVVFVHFVLKPADLQPHVPFELDRWEDRAYVSLVAFTQRRLRPRAGGRLAALLSAPLATHPFLNVRTYVRHRGEIGIFFLSEWIPNRLATLIGPRLYGLPYMFARLHYRYDATNGIARHSIHAGDRLEFDAIADPGIAAHPAPLASNERFFLERYTAFTRCRGRNVCFRIRHAPWLQKPARVKMLRTGLLERLPFALAGLRPIRAQASPGLKDVWLGPPMAC